VLADEQMGGGDAAVDDAALVEVGEGRGGGRDDAGDLGHGHRADHVERTTAMGESQLPPIIGARGAQELHDPWVGGDLEPLGLRSQSGDGGGAGRPLHDHGRCGISDKLGALDHSRTI
jgi:hypothetical protein